MMQSDHELDAPPWRRVDGTLMSVGRSIRQAYDRALAETGVNLPESQLLAYLAESEPQTQVQLAGRFGTNRAVTGARIDALEKLDAIERRAHPTDRRVWVVHITQTGRELVATINDIDRGIRRQLRSGISREERQQLASMLVRIQRNLAAIADMPDAASVQDAPAASSG